MGGDDVPVASRPASGDTALGGREATYDACAAVGEEACGRNVRSVGDAGSTRDDAGYGPAEREGAPWRR